MPPCLFVLPDHFQELLCDRKVHVSIDLVVLELLCDETALHVLCLSFFGAEVEKIWQEVLLSY